MFGFPTKTSFQNALDLGLVNEAMAIWNEAAVKSLTDLIPDTNYNDFPRRNEPNIINRPLFQKNIDDVRDKTQWQSNLLEACNLIRTLTPTKQASLENKPLNIATFERIQELLTTNNISTKNRYPSNQSDIRHFISFLNSQRKQHTGYVKQQKNKEWTEKMTASRKFAFKWLKEKPQPLPTASNCNGNFCANPDQNVKHMREAWAQYIENYKDEPHLDPNDFNDLF